MSSTTGLANQITQKVQSEKFLWYAITLFTIKQKLDFDIHHHLYALALSHHFNCMLFIGIIV